MNIGCISSLPGTTTIDTSSNSIDSRAGHIPILKYYIKNDKYSLKCLTNENPI